MASCVNRPSGGFLVEFVPGGKSRKRNTFPKAVIADEKVIWPPRAGLHGIQGLRMSATETTLFLVDPAFGRASADAAIIARRIPTQEIQIVTAGSDWNVGNKSWTLPESVDWIDRSVVVRIDERNAKTSELVHDLLAFECVARSASGHISEDFYAQEMRRVRTFLGKIAERGRARDGQISLFLNGKVHTVSLDEGAVQVGGGEA
jgi:hypothetical protein